MKLERIRIQQFRKFDAAVEIAGLEHGLNILHGPNEAGKSTIAQALRTAFFERHNAGGVQFVQAISPAGVADAAPSIEVDFSLGSDHCKLAKTFLQKPRASLVIGAARWDGADADEQLAERLGFALSLKGASSAKSHGIPGLLWVEQGASAELESPVASATSSLEERLRSILGDITSSAGGDLAAAIQTELGKLRTAKTNKPVGVLAETLRQLNEARQQRDSLQAAAQDYRALTDGLADSMAKLDQLERDKPWEAYAQQKRDAEAQKAALEPQQRALTADRESLREVKARLENLHAQSAARDKELGALMAQREALASALQSQQQAVESLELAEQRHRAAHDALTQARQRHQAAQQRQQQQSWHDELVRIRADIKRIEAILSKANQFGQSIAALRTEAATIKLAKRDLAKLVTLDQSLREKRIQRDATATRIGYRLEAGQQIDAGPLGLLAGSGNKDISAPLILRIVGVGEIQITPGGEDIARLSDDVERLENEIHNLCATLGVTDLADAQARRTRGQELEQTIALEEKERDTLLDQRNEAEWRDQLAEAQGQCLDREQRLLDLSVVEDAVSMDVARRDYADAETDARAAETHCKAHQHAAEQAKLVAGALQAHVDSESRRLESGDARASAESRSRELAEAAARRDALDVQITEATRVLAEREPERIDADIDRISLALSTVERQRQDLREAISEARGKLETLGAGGLDEKLDEKAVVAENLARRVAQYELRADALTLLKSSLAAHQEAAVQRLYAPLRQRLAHYLGILFPNTALHIGVDQLRPTVLGRGGTDLALEDHSHGTREQLGVVARFAYADLLKEAGQPTLLILDDALVHSDADRRGQMKRILHDASQRHQILLFTCHPEDWRDAGARAMVDVARLGSPLQL